MDQHSADQRPIEGASRAGFPRALAAAAAALALAVPTATAGDHVALRGGTVMNASGEPVEGATVLMEDGVIKAVGKDIEIPYDAKVHDVEGKILFPGLVLAHTTWGLDSANESTPVTPYVDVYDAIDPNAMDYEECRRAGITTLHVIPGNNCVVSGVGRVVRPDGMLVEEMTVRASGGMKLSITPKSGFNRMTQMAELRKAFMDYERAIGDQGEKKYAEVQKEKGEKVMLAPDDAAAAGLAEMSDDDIDVRWRNFHRMKNGEITVYLHADRAGDVGRAIDFANEMGLMNSVVWVLGTETYKVVDAIKATGRPVVLEANLTHRETDPNTGEVEETFVPKVFHDAGVSFALEPSNEGLNYQAARLVREGLPRETALNAITQTAADTIGLGELLGSIEVGKHGNVVVLSGDPLAQTTVVEHTFAEGKHIYDRSKDRRLQELFSGKDQPLDSDGTDG